MLFNSYVFLLVFLPLVLVGWWGLGRCTSLRLALLTAASYAFYGWWDWRFVGLLALSTLVDYWVGLGLARSQNRWARRLLLTSSLSCNLGLLAFFKYSGFFAQSLNGVAQWLQVGGQLPVPQLVLPVGISFYTFQTLSYSIDLYRGIVRPARSLLHFSAYVSLFPQLIAGPIVRYQQMETQLDSLASRPDWQQIATGLRFFVVGLSQKILLADMVARRIDPMLLEYEQLQLVSSWYAMVGYACQLYFDFAGYSNMAVGLGHWLGFSFPQNFDSPYRAATIASFWRRWHISLSSWLRDYLFIPLGGSRRGRWLTTRNLLIVMLLGGLWHGAGWTFVLWGLYHALLLAVHAAWRRLDRFHFPQPVAVLVTFASVLFGWVLFRATSLAMARQVASAMLGWRGVDPVPLAACGGAVGWLVVGVALGVIFLAPNVWRLRLPRNALAACGLSLLLVVCILRLDAESPFLYFQF